MDYQIIWSPLAIERFEMIIRYLLENWSEKESSKFIDRTNNVLEKITNNPELYRKSKRKLHEALVTKHNLLVYRISRNRTIELVSFFDTRQHPRKKLKG